MYHYLVGDHKILGLQMLRTIFITHMSIRIIVVLLRRIRQILSETVLRTLLLLLRSFE